jgi:hypothetical protein
MAKEEGARTLQEGASFPTFCTFQGVLKSYEHNHDVKFVIRHSRTLVAHNKRVKESETFFCVSEAGSPENLARMG